ncbi:MAG: ROK family protein, partial [Cellvibrionaceae bacterium]|nr:ROK family protein [Cellvibrionaceae bacterium]
MNHHSPQQRLGIDLGGSKIEALLLEGADKVLARRRLPTPQGDYPATLDTIAELVTSLQGEFALPPKLPLGIGTPGAISAKTGRMKNCNSICLNGEDLLGDLKTRLQRPVQLANDADCFALAEARVGAGRGRRTVFGVILGTGVGGGIVIGGQLHRGPSHIAGEWGHNPLPLSAALALDLSPYRPQRRCYCGRINCVETWLSGPALAQSYKELSGERLEPAAIVAAAKRADTMAQKALADYRQLLALALANVINILDPDTIVLGGGLSQLPELAQA